MFWSVGTNLELESEFGMFGAIKSKINNQIHRSIFKLIAINIPRLWPSF